MHGLIEEKQGGLLGCSTVGKGRDESKLVADQSIFRALEIAERTMDFIMSKEESHWRVL